MSSPDDPSRRRLLRTYLLGAALIPLAAARLRTASAEETALLSPDDPAAKTLKYTEDASKVKGNSPDNTCATCALYQGKYGSKQGPCQIFPGKQVKATGWCSSWAPQM